MSAAASTTAATVSVDARTAAVRKSVRSPAPTAGIASAVPRNRVAAPRIGDAGTIVVPRTGVPETAETAEIGAFSGTDVDRYSRSEAAPRT